jgi:hypothetical protein
VILKRILLLASMALAAVALAAPVTAQANKFTYEGSVNIHGNISSTVQVGMFTFQQGPCTVSDTGTILSATTAEIPSLEAEVPCPTNVIGCELTEVNISPGLIAHLTTPDGITITSVGVTTTYNDGCTTFGIMPGEERRAEGNLTGTTTTNGCIHFSQAGHMLTVPTGAPFAVDGEVCLTEDTPEEPATDGDPVVIH